MVFHKIKENLYLLPAAAFLVMIANGYGLFANGYIYKTFLLYVLVMLLYLLVEWWLKPQMRKQGVGVGSTSWKWILFLSLPLLGTFPGLFISGGEVNYNLGHEVAIHIGYMFWFSYLVWSLQDESGVEKFLYIVGGGAIYLVIVGFLGIDITGADPQLVQRSTFGGKNLYSNFLITWIPLFLLLSLPVRLQGEKGIELESWSKENTYFMVVLLFALAGLFQAQARSAMVGLLGVLFLLGSYLLYLYFKRKYKIRWTYYVAATAVLILVVPFFFYGVAAQIDEQTVRGSRFLSLATWHGWSSRLMPWQVAWSSIMDAPWFGWGAGSSFNLFFQYVPEESRLFSSSRSYSHVHNEWLEVMQEGGVFGVLLLMMIIIIGGHYLRKHLGQKIVLGAGLGVVAYLFHGTFSLATRMTLNEVSLYSLVAILVVLTVAKSSNERCCSRISRWIGATALVVMGVAGASTLQGNYDLRQLQIEKIETMEEGRAQVDRYIDSKGVEALHWLAVKQIKRGERRRLGEVLDRIDNKITGFRDVPVLRALNYQIAAGLELDVVRFKRLMLKQWQVDRYHLPVLHWLARISAWEKNEREVLLRISELFQYHVLYNRILPISKIEAVKVKVHDELDGFALVVSSEGAILMVGKKVLSQVMDDLRSINSREQSTVVYKNYVKKVYLQMDPDGFSESDLKKIKGLMKDVLSRLAVWSRVPNV